MLLIHIVLYIAYTLYNMVDKELFCFPKQSSQMGIVRLTSFRMFAFCKSSILALTQEQNKY